MTTTYVSDGDLATPANFNTWLNAAGGEVFNVKASAYGATGDGTTDDTTAIQAAIDAAATAGGGTVVFPVPDDSYVVNSGLTISSTSVRLIGLGRETTRAVKLKKTSGTTPIITVTGTDASYVRGFAIHRLDFQGRNVAGEGPLLDLRFVSLAHFSQSHWTSCAGKLVRCRAVQDTKFVDCAFESGGSATNTLYAVSLEDDTSATINCNQVHFRGCRWETNTYGHLLIQGRTGTRAFQCYLTDCKFESVSPLTNPVTLEQVEGISLDGIVNTVTSANTSPPLHLFVLDGANEVHAKGVTIQSLSTTANADYGFTLNNDSHLSLTNVGVACNLDIAIAHIQDTSSRVFVGSRVGTVDGYTAKALVAVSGSATLAQVFTPLVRVETDPSSATATGVEQLGLFYNKGDERLYVYRAGAWVSAGTVFGAARPAYTPTNVSTDRAYDADATTVAELADVLGTLIADLQTAGLLT